MKPTYGSRRTAVTRSVFILGLIVASIVVVYLQVQWMNRRPTLRDASLEQYRHIIEQQTMRVLCDTCNGSGLVRDPEHPDKMVACPVCRGIGIHRIRLLKDNEVLCPECRGLGFIPGDRFDEAKVCPRCQGVGLVARDWDKLKIPVQQVVCPHCDGRGVLRNPDNPAVLERCPVCFGLGSHLVRRLDGYNEICPACSGMGRLIDEETGEARWCRLCEGRGLIISQPQDEQSAAAVAP